MFGLYGPLIRGVTDEIESFGDVQRGASNEAWPRLMLYLRLHVHVLILNPIYHELNVQEKTRRSQTAGGPFVAGLFGGLHLIVSAPKST